MAEVRDEEDGLEQPQEQATTIDRSAALTDQKRPSFLHTLNNINQKRPSSFIKKRSTTLDQTTLKFEDIYFLVGKPTKKNPTPKKILTKVSGKVQHGRVLAIMGPSGAGKTTLISALTLDAFYGVPVGTVTLNGVPLTGNLFKKHCFVVKQQDKHWPWLTTRETLEYAAGLFEVGSPDTVPLIVDELIKKLGLQICADTRCIRLSGGQKRRLSIAVALLKQPTLLFLDEPTSGLDAAAASNIMREITRVAKEESLIVLCTIHQPSTKVYQGFDQVMIMSRGRQAYMGPAEGTAGKPGAADYFGSIGHPLPDATNPADHFLDLVNSDFSGEEEVNKILDAWEEAPKPESNSQDEADGIDDDFKAVSLGREIKIMFSRHLTLILRDPILYLGRFGVFLFMNLVFSFVYWSAREHVQSQIFNKMWIQTWMGGVPANMGVVAVYVLNDEFKSIQRECQNGMSRAATYVMAKTMLVLPLFFVFGLFGLVIPSFVIQDTPWSIFGQILLLYAAFMFVFESVAELLSVAFSDPILGMLGFMSFWFCCFLFGGFLISLDDLVWPFKAFYYFMPFGYYLRSTMYLIVDNIAWEGLSTREAFTVLGAVYPLIENEDTVWQDFFTLLGIGVAWKLMYIVMVFIESRKVANIQSPDKISIAQKKEKTLSEEEHV